MHFTDYPAERLYIDSIDSRLSPDGKKARLEIMNFTINHKRPYNINSDASSLAESTVDELKSKNAAIINADGEVQFIYPVSSVPTGHTVNLADGRQFSAMCAIDAMGSAFTFRQDVTVTSACAQCGDPVEVSIKNGSLAGVSPDSLHALHVDLNLNQDWSSSC